MEDKMTAGAFGRTKNDGWDSPFNSDPEVVPSEGWLAKTMMWLYLTMQQV